MADDDGIPQEHQPTQQEHEGDHAREGRAAEVKTEHHADQTHERRETGAGTAPRESPMQARRAPRPRRARARPVRPRRRRQQRPVPPTQHHRDRGRAEREPGLWDLFGRETNFTRAGYRDPFSGVGLMNNQCGLFGGAVILPGLKTGSGSLLPGRGSVFDLQGGIFSPRTYSDPFQGIFDRPPKSGRKKKR